MNVESEFIIDTKHNEKLMKLSKIKEIHLGKASKGLEKVKAKHKKCFSIIKQKMSGQETLDFETKRASDRTEIILKILDQMAAIGLNEEKLSDIKYKVVRNEKQNEILKITLDLDISKGSKEISEKLPSNLDSQIFSRISKLAEQQKILEMRTNVWSLFQHINNQRVGMKVIVGPEVFMDKERRQSSPMTVNLIQIQEMALWNGPDGFQAAGKPNNVSFSIMHYNGTEWETLGFEMNTTEDRTALVMEIIDKLQPLGIIPAQGLSRQIVLDSMGLDDTLQILFDYDDPDNTANAAVDVEKEEDYLELMEELEQQNKQNEKLKEHLDQRNEEIKELQSQRNLMTKAMQECGDKLTAERKRNEALQKEMSVVRQHNEHLVDAEGSGEATDKIVENENLKKQIKDLTEKNAELRQLNEDRKEQMHEDMNSNREKSEAKIEELKSALANATSELKKQREQNDSLNEAHDEVLADREIMKQEKEELEHKLHVAMEKNEALVDEVAAHTGVSDSQIEQLKLELDAVRNDLEEEKGEKKKQEKKYQELEQKHVGVMGQLATLEKDYVKLEGNLASEMKAIEDEKVKLISNREATEAKIEKLHSAKKSWVLLMKTFREMKDEMKLITISQKSQLEEVSTFFGDFSASQLTKAFDINRFLVDDLLKKYRRELTLRRKYFNMVQNLRGNIRVFCRFRPLLPFELEKGFTECVKFPHEGAVKIVDDKGKTVPFEFDQVYTPKTTQEEVSKDTTEYIQSVLDGYTVSIFAYGQTGSGKTYTMNGPKENPGVNLRALKHLFKITEERAPQFQYKIEVSIFEIYNEKINDLICGAQEQLHGEADDGTKKKTLQKAQNAKKEDVHHNFKIQHLPDGSVEISGLTKIEVQNDDDINALNHIALQNRTANKTDMNAHSSRSHMLLVVDVKGINITSNIKYVGKLYLVDLAGSERVKKSGVTGKALKEAQNINKSLSALGDVLQALQHKDTHIPYRNSTLTDVMTNALGGNAKTIMFINCCPASAHAFETVSSLKFAKRVEKVELGQAKAKTHTKKVTNALKATRALKGTKAPKGRMAPKGRIAPKGTKAAKVTKALKVTRALKGKRVPKGTKAKH